MREGADGSRSLASERDQVGSELEARFGAVCAVMCPDVRQLSLISTECARVSSPRADVPGASLRSFRERVLREEVVVFERCVSVLQHDLACWPIRAHGS